MEDAFHSADSVMTACETQVCCHCVVVRMVCKTSNVLLMLVAGCCVRSSMCMLQLRMIPLGLKNLKIPSVEEMKKVFDERNAKVPEGKRKFTKGMLEFEELMRLLDDAVSCRYCTRCNTVDVQSQRQYAF